MPEDINQIPVEINKIEIEPNEKPKKKFFGKKFFLFILVLLILIIILCVAIAVPGYFAYQKAMNVYQESLALKDLVKTKDLKQINDQILLTKKSLSDLDVSLKPLSWIKAVPFVGVYESDAEHAVKAAGAGLEAGEIVIAAIEPYSDLMGLSGARVAGDGEKTTQDRITFLVTTIDKVGPELDKINEKLVIIKKEIDQIDPKRYPKEFKGQKIQEPMQEAITMLDQIVSLSTEAKPLFEVAPWLLGIDSTRRYLVLFQNDAELRSTGGFLTAYAILEVNKGKITPVLSNDIYTLDARFTKKIPAPDPIKTFLNKQDPYFHLRDMNLSPDFAVSMQGFLENYQTIDKTKIDGLIAVDTKVLVALLKVLGQIGVSGWGNFSAEPDPRCDGCPQVVYVLELLADKPVSMIRTDRKAVIGPLMHSILANAMGSPKEKVAPLFNAGFSSLLEKHVLFYFPDEKIQKAIESFNIGGRVRDFDGDYLYLNDTSFSGAKTNLFLKQEVDQKIEIKDGKVTKTVTVEYQNPSAASNCNLEAGQLCLNAPYRNWFRLYVPKGAKLLESSGSEIDIKTYEDLGKTVFEGFFGDKYPLRPQGSAKVTFKYEFTLSSKTEYKLMIQKQPGTDGALYTVQVNNQKQEFELSTDKELRFKL
jgi:hypothetical protein